MTDGTVTAYRLKTPCKHCPFRSDLDKYLRSERAQEIAESLYGGAEFPCHKTTEHFEGEDGMEERVATPDSKFCAGALITMEHEGYSNQMVRIAERMGWYDPSGLNMEAPVYRSLDEWVASYRTTPTVTTKDGEVLEFEHCGVVGDHCEDPPGWSAGGGVWSSTEEPQCDPTKCCWACGNPMCSACNAGPPEDGGMDGEEYCVFCAEERAEQA